MAEFHETLNPVIWEKYKEGYILKPEVKRKLRQIADAFIESLEINKEAVEDIVITGSMASYNYTPHSDIDLHLLIDFEKVHKDCPIVGDYLLSKKSEFNQKHDIFIYGIPVEVYAEAIGNDNVHNGLYSLDLGWIDLPQKLKPTTNDSAVKAKYEEYREAADGIKDGDLAEKLLDKIKKMRKSGLAEGGEFSVENLVFKKLRDTGVIEKLMQVKKEGIDKKLSLGEALDIMEQILDEMEGLGGAGSINTGTSVFAPYPVDVVGRENPFKVKKEGKKKREKKAILGYRYKKNWGKAVSSLVEAIVDEVWGGSSPVSSYEVKNLKREKMKKKKVYMSPDEYIKRATRLAGSSTSRATKKNIQDNIKDRSSDPKEIENYKQAITTKSGQMKVPMLQYDKENPGQEGLHRAVAAKNAGVKSMPVHIYHSTQKNGNWSTSDKKEARQREKVRKEEAKAREIERKKKEAEEKKKQAEIEADRKANPEKYKKLDKKYEQWQREYIEQRKKDNQWVLGPDWGL